MGLLQIGAQGCGSAEGQPKSTLPLWEGPGSCKRVSDRFKCIGAADITSLRPRTSSQRYAGPVNISQKDRPVLSSGYTWYLVAISRYPTWWPLIFGAASICMNHSCYTCQASGDPSSKQPCVTRKQLIMFGFPRWSHVLAIMIYIYIYIHGLTCFNTLIGCDLHNQGFQILLNMFHRVFE